MCLWIFVFFVFVGVDNLSVCWSSYDAHVCMCVYGYLFFFVFVGVDNLSVCWSSYNAYVCMCVYGYLFFFCFCGCG